MKAEDLRSKSSDELTKSVLDMRKEQFNLRFQKANGQLENTAQLRGLRRNIARAKTIQAEQALGLNKTAKPAAKKESVKTAETKTTAKKPAAKKAAPKKTAAKKEDK